MLPSAKATDTASAPGVYRGDVVLTVAVASPVNWFGLTFPFRQALYVGAAGVDLAKNVTSAITGGLVTNTFARAIRIRSGGEAFNGVYVDNGQYTLLQPRVRFEGNGRNDFSGYGAAIEGTGSQTRLVIDGARIRVTGAVRPGVVATNGANVIVKDSSIRTCDGVLPGDYQPTIFPLYALSAPWMLGIVGDVRATLMVGAGTKATYLNSNVFSCGWGVLSTDSTSDSQLTATDTHVATGREGYGSYADGSTVIDRFLGSRFDVNDYATISTGGTVVYGDSDPGTVSQLNDSLDLGLTPRQLARIPDLPTVIHSDRFGVMWHSGGQPTYTFNGGIMTIGGRTQLSTDQTTFLDKGVHVAVNVDGSQGARIRTGNGVLYQMMETDDPGPVVVDGQVLDEGVYHEPTGVPVKDPTFDPTTAQADDSVLNLSHIHLDGDVYHGLRGSATTGKNVVLNLDDTRLEGVVSASTTHNAVSTITSADYKQLGEVTNTPSPVINNG